MPRSYSDLLRRIYCTTLLFCRVGKKRRIYDWATTGNQVIWHTSFVSMALSLFVMHLLMSSTNGGGGMLAYPGAIDFFPYLFVKSPYPGAVIFIYLDIYCWGCRTLCQKTSSGPRYGQGFMLNSPTCPHSPRWCKTLIGALFQTAENAEWNPSSYKKCYSCIEVSDE